MGFELWDLCLGRLLDSFNKLWFPTPTKNWHFHELTNKEVIILQKRLFDWFLHFMKVVIAIFDRTMVVYQDWFF
jgi:hypothetical protein